MSVCYQMRSRINNLKGTIMSKPKFRIANHQARAYVQELKPFVANNIFAEFRRDENGNDKYVVFSYGQHWPLFIFDYQTDAWYENKSKYGVTTSKHHSQTHPHQETIPLHVDDMIKVVDRGVTAIIEGVEA